MMNKKIGAGAYGHTPLLPWHGKIKSTGNDRVDFLNRLLTNDILNLPIGQSCPAAFLSATGKVLALMDVLKLEDYLLLDVEKEQNKRIIQLLEKFVITEDVIFSDVTGTVPGTAGTGSQNPSRNVPGTERGQAPSEEAYETSRIERGELRYGIDINETIILNETGLENTVASETKGCYPGQEVVARIKTYGGLNRRIMGIILEDANFRSHPRMLLQRSSPLGSGIQSITLDSRLQLAGMTGKGGDDKPQIFSNNKEIGFITSACFSPKLEKVLALGYLKKGYFESEGVEVEVEIKGGRIRGRTVKLPFIRNNRE